MKNVYSVVRTYNGAEYLEVEAESEEEAIQIAQKANDAEWETNPNDEYIDKYSYDAELIEDEED